jgi:hypothetical protein
VKLWHRFAKVDEQDLGAFRGCERNRWLGRDASAIPGAENHVTQGDLSLHDVEPGASPLRKLVDHVLPGVEQGRVNQGVLVDAQRSSAGVERGDDAQSAPALRRGEAFLFMSRIEIDLGWAQPDLEEMNPVVARRVRPVR